MTLSQDVPSATIEAQVAGFQANYRSIEEEMGKVIVGHKEVVARLRGVGFEELCRETTENAGRLFGERLLAV